MNGRETKDTAEPRDAISGDGVNTKAGFDWPDDVREVASAWADAVQIEADGNLSAEDVRRLQETRDGLRAMIAKAGERLEGSIEFPAGIEWNGFASRYVQQCERGVHGPDAELLAKLAIGFAHLLLKKQASYGAQILRSRLLCPNEKPTASILSRKSDKIERIIGLVSGSAVDQVGEALADTIADDAGYSLLWILASYLERVE